MSIPYQVIPARLGWAYGVVSELPPGAHIVLLGAEASHCAEGRRAGLTFRDTLLIAGRNGLECAALFRTPLEGPVTEQVLKTGTGAMWIDGSRISGAPHQINAYASVSAQGCVNRPGESTHAGESYESRISTQGRWPTNLVLLHESGCYQDGTRKLRASGGHYPIPRSPTHVYAQDTYTKTKLTQSVVEYAGPDGMETVPAWKCVTGCSVAALDEQSGLLKSGGGDKSGARVGNVAFGEMERGAARPHDPDTGGASRFYPQFAHMNEARTWFARLVGGEKP